ncbi:enoyl-CoA hydratase [Beggiatoa leptomitoformis]|uniref:Enoyl-CoA hydratase domain-containing protein 3, mitochondrial n=1 Tax=Beggiatoa leptomitoformis TaxID=288004 RepID=A0A2N9YGI9_9GAMM|nr:enoyl-CoA hydratase [Beggiatoa leptomitoformis]ALG68110.1 enoyl-CoA hydratase [Beggiatoa leptomitoformis]AUI69593.1 enoyl-CoA hydratase [Beggiatoa leptomitoformis]
MSAVLDLEQQPYLHRQDAQGITTLTLNRPKQYNALSQAMLHALQTELDLIAKEEHINVVIIAAEGKAFCAGHDLKEIRSQHDEAFCHTLFQQCGKVMQTINQLPQPVIAQVQGIATAAGCQLVAACDLAVSVDTAKFATSGINVGLFCSTPAVPLSRNLPRKQAMELLLTGDFIDASTALQYGLINRVVPAEQLVSSVQVLAESIAAKSTTAIRMGKQLFYKQLEMPLIDAYRYAAEVMVCNIMDDDAKEGIDAFIQKRQPVWKK